MEVKAKLLNTANAAAQTEVKASELNAKVENLAKKAAKNIKIDGFRKGKVPVAQVLKRYGKDLENDAKSEIFRDIVNESLKLIAKKSSDIIGEPMILKFDEKDGNIDIELEISFKPEVKVDGYEEIIPEYTTPKVTKKEIEEKINEFLKMIAPLEKVEKESLEKGDFAKFDFEGFVDGEAFEGGKAEGYLLEIGSGQFIPGFEDGMLGLKVGEQKDVNVTFPAEYGAAHLAGKSAVFKVKLHEIQGKKAGKLDEETLKKLMPNEENPTAEQLEDRIKEQIRADKFQKLLNEDLKPKFADKAVEKFKFDLPNNIVEQEIDMQFRSAWGNFSEDEMKKFREDKEALKKQRETYKNEAIKSVQLTFIIDELAKQKGITVSDNELLQAVYFEAYRYGIDPKEHLESYKKQGMLPAVKMAMIEEKLFNNLFKSGNKEDKGE
ncbi:trigger factor [Campylobacter fetus]|uniref:trigger factor n=1 Tax=Campylobacter TaxID=194 RepID=UPI000508F65B|nr:MULTISPECIES: trigger factor [Campylobacter]HDX6330766.1 trigger factor [Campylobacter fetus subsp. venerealis]AIR79543.1 trigger factor (peptidyl-prolyl cis /trans isomerase, chaperone) [Campylobacter fetus subsp. fetus 04/554]EAI5647515.1 trigger factor [Campylobacter fetus]EAI5944658.1 trigger factor [Campylobacter fetus]EAJ0319966.1 trigger factor [Campylobacter fetus]